MNMKEIKPKVTAVILNYNRPYYIPKVIASLRAQKRVDLEIILFDNNPTGEEYDTDVHIKSDKNFIISASVLVSRFPVGSSAKMISGSFANDRAIATR